MLDWMSMQQKSVVVSTKGKFVLVFQGASKEAETKIHKGFAAGREEIPSSQRD